jgi:type 1 glutamine amidotransferase
VFVTALGHDLASINQAGFIATFVRGAEWAATGVVTIPVPPELQQ